MPEQEFLNAVSQFGGGEGELGQHVLQHPSLL